MVMQSEQIDQVRVATSAQLQQAWQRVKRPHAVSLHVHADYLQTGCYCHVWRRLWLRGLWCWPRRPVVCFAVPCHWCASRRAA